MVPTRSFNHHKGETAMKKQVMCAVLAVVLAGGWYVAQAGPMGMGKGDHHGPQAQAGEFGCRQQGGCRQQAGCKQGGGGLGPLTGIADELGLTDSQRQQIEVIVTAQHEQNAPLREKMIAGKKQLWEASRGSSVDEAAIADLAAEQGKLMSEMIVSRIHCKNLILAVLTPEQQAQAAKLEESRGPGFGRPGCDQPGCGHGPDSDEAVPPTPQ